MKINSMCDRHQFRANWHDYNGGVYFITICSFHRKPSFGKIVGTRFFASALGEILTVHLKNIPTHYNDVELWNYVVMPNHIHFVIAVGTRFFASNQAYQFKFGCLKPPQHGNPVDDFHHNSRLATIVGAFKAGVTRECRTRKIASLPCWQIRFHEHVIRSQRTFENIMNYIDNNVINWDKDCLNEEV